MKPFDEKFAENVREVFDTFHEPADMKAWDRLRQKLTRKQKSRFITLPSWPALTAAASVLLLIISLLWFFPGVKNFSQPEFAITEPEQRTEPTIDKLTGQNDVHKKNGETIPVSTADNIGLKAAQQYGAASEVIISKIPEPVTNIKAEITDVDKVTGSGEANYTEEKALTEGLQTIQPSKEPDSPFAAKPYNDQIAPGQNIFFKDENNQITDMRTGSMLQITAGSMLSFTENQVADGIGFAAGILNEWKITNGVSLSTGGILTYNQFSFDPHPGHKSDYVAIPSYPVQNNEDWVGLFNYNFKNQYQIIAIDIPINARFRINNPSQRNQLYLSAGLSSLLYLQEQFTENSLVFTESHILDASSGELSKVLYATKKTENEKIYAFQRFDFARLLNLSFGYAIKRGKYAILIEPFLKYPLGGITSRDINLGMGGISLRYSFN